MFSSISYRGKTKKDSIPKTLSSEKPITSSLDSISIIGQAQVLLQTPKQKEKLLLEKIKQDENIAHLFLQKDKNQVTYMFCNNDDLNETLAYVNFFYDNNDEIDEIYVFDIRTENLTRYDNEGNYQTQYTPQDLKGVSGYKYNSYYFHSRLRDKRQYENNELLDNLNNIFADKSKLHKAKKDMIMYRTHHLTPKEMGKIGDIYQDSSFLSTSTNEIVSKSFYYDKNKAFLIIKVPKDSSFLDVDKIFNIKNRRSREEEFLFDKGTKFLIEDINNTNEVTLSVIKLLTDEEKVNSNEN